MFGIGIGVSGRCFLRSAFAFAIWLGSVHAILGRNPKGSSLPERHSLLCFLCRHPACPAAHASIGTLAGSFA